MCTHEAMQPCGLQAKDMFTSGAGYSYNYVSIKY